MIEPKRGRRSHYHPISRPVLPTAEIKKSTEASQKSGTGIASTPVPHSNNNRVAQLSHFC